MKDEKLRGIPKIIETPKGKKEEDMDRVNLDLLKTIAGTYTKGNKVAHGAG